MITPEQRAAIRELQRIDRQVKEEEARNQAEMERTQRLDQALEARRQVVRTQEIGQIGESALVRLLDEGDAEAHAYQRQQMAALREELAPAGSSVMERLLAETIVKARFEAMMWSARSDQLILERQPVKEQYDQQAPQEQRRLKDKLISLAREQVHCEERGRQAEKRYLQALRELANLRRLSATLLQVNLAQATPLPVPPTERALAPAHGTAWDAPSLLTPDSVEMTQEAPADL